MTTLTSPQRTAPPVTRRAILLGVPLAFAALTLLHPQQDPHELGSAATRWLVVHALQLILTVLLAYSIWMLLDGLAGRAALLARGAIPAFLVFFSAFDGVAGLATGWLEQDAHHHGTADQATIRAAIDELFNGNWLTGNLSIAGAATAFSWLAITIASAVALHQAGAGGLTVAAMAAASLFASHPPPFGTIGLLAFFLAAYRWDRRRRAFGITGPGVGSPPPSPSE
ncbi:hypothetical protein AB0M20_25920 [Actinoplanes sp. NPDC051633]|uniref:hypothetical protein n=1 Tax=Actinoplanes sp. NPDC051633 TaxID=3155670 RepID=UPI0034354469